MKITRSLVSFLILGVITITSCNKEPKVDPNLSNKNPLELISRLGDEESDFSIKVLTSLGHSLFAENSLNRAVVFLEAASNSENNVGDLTVEQQQVPFNELSYFYQLDTLQNPLSFTGKHNTYVLNGNGAEIPSFNLDNYSAKLTDITLEGLVNNKLPKNSSLTVSWTPDQELPESTESAVYISGEDESGSIKTLSKMVSDDSGSLTIASSEMGNFANYEKIRVFYARGFSNVHTVSERTIEIGSIGFTYCTVFIKQ